MVLTLWSIRSRFTNIDTKKLYGPYSINGRNMWRKSPCPFTLTPLHHHQHVGNLKKKRKRSQTKALSQGKSLSGKHLTVTCSKGYNSRSCKGQGGPSALSQGKKNGKGLGGACCLVSSLFVLICLIVKQCGTLLLFGLRHDVLTHF
uniref:Uncharacterized protein n=1 Tax=Lactuca sativa TaxID=4236 RepID=A0A9R1V0R4_LACSA|nr:hypothetical protein LSAT_V11C700376220 [Lactuca sativa]